jgi:hypothetical protein
MILLAHEFFLFFLLDHEWIFHLAQFVLQFALSWHQIV